MSKHWVYTLNNPRDEEVNAVKLWATTYHVHGKEVSDSGTNHIQGYAIFPSNKRLAAVKKLQGRAHWEMAKGTPLEASNYCKKDGQVWETGALPASKGSGNKLRWDLARQACKEGRLEDVPDEIYLRFYKTLKEIKKDHMVKPASLPGVCGLWVWGASGSGKSHAVIHQHPNRYIKPLNKWWDGYQGEDVVHLDEIAPSHAPWITPYLKKWADKWPFDAEVKGGAMQIRPRRVIVTSNYSISQMFFGSEDEPAIRRRFEEVEKFLCQSIIV